MTAIGEASLRLQTEEGFRGLPYKDTRGHTTIAYGFNVDAGISKYAAGALLVAQLTELDATLAGYAWYKNANDVRKSVFLDVAYSSGLHGLLNFPHMLAAAASGDWATAASECKVVEPELAGRYAALAELLRVAPETTKPQTSEA
jgi:GH24 family phage-related lysozyme (muramidase)